MDTDEFGGFALGAQPKPQTDEFGGVPISQPEQPSGAAFPAIKQAVQPVLKAFAQDFQEGFGPEKMGLPDKDAEWLSKVGIFAPKGAEKFDSPFQAFNELLIETLWRTGELAARGSSGLYRGLQGAAVEAGIPRDIASMPDAFFGSPHPTGIPKVAEIGDIRPTRAIEAEREAGAPMEPPGEPPPPSGPASPGLEQARKLGVIGSEQPSPADGTPAQAAERAVPSDAPEQPRTMAAGRTGDETISEPAPSNPARDKAGNIRLDQIGINADAKDVMMEAAKANDDFMTARNGDIPLEQVSSISDASGIPVTELQGNSGLGRLMNNDAVVRTWLQAFHQASDEIAAKMKEVALTGDEKAVEELREMKLRFAHMQEQVSGLTAEAGRTLAVFREFYESKGKAEALGKVLEDNPGNDAESLKKMARAGAGLEDRTQVARFMNDSRQPGFWDKAIFYWVNALISGPITHAKYVMANAAFAGYEAGVVTPIAGAIGLVRKVTGIGAEDRVLVGETAARLWGLVAGTPDALVAAWQAARSGMQTPLPGELAQSIIPKQNKNVFFQQKPIPGTIGTILSVPSRGASAIHSFFNFLGYRAELEQQAYRAAAKDGMSPSQEGFWQRRQQMVNNPTKEMMDSAIEEGYRLTFLTELGPTAKKVSQAINSYPPFRLVMPFVHIPFNILKAATDNTVVGLLRKDVRDDVLGKNGVPKQDRAIARVVAGSAVGAWVMNQVLNDNITGYGPTDQKERSLWLLTHQPYSIRMGNEWVSYNRFGPIGTLIGLHANLAEVIPHLKWDSDEITKAAALLVHSTGRLVEDEVGMQGLAGIMQAIEEPERKGTRFASSFAASWLPYSSALRQTASVMDPEMREAKTFIDGIKYTVPGARETLLPKRDWTGTPVENPGYHSLLRTGTVNNDPVNLELQRLDIKPTPPSDRIGGVKLSPEMFDKYQSTAGPYTKMALEHLVNQPNWQELPAYVREHTMRAVIKSTRESAAAMMQAAHPELIQQGVQQRMDYISGKTSTARPKKPPAVP